DGDPPERYQRLKHVGDTALFVSGIFTESLESKAVGPDYYTSLGGLAYRDLASLPGTQLGKGVIALFTEMSARFLDFVRVLSHMRVVRQPSLRVIGSSRSTKMASQRRALRKWLMITTVPPGLHTRTISFISPAWSGTTLTTWKAVT